jgi:hypothetical protein
MFLLSTCYQPFQSTAHSTYFGYLLRLYLAWGTDELLPHQQAAADQRLHELSVRLGVDEAREPVPAPLAKRLAHALSCARCREGVRRGVSLFEALGPAALSAVA